MDKEKSMNDQTVAALKSVIEENRLAMEDSYQRLADGYAQRQTDADNRLKQAKE